MSGIAALYSRSQRPADIGAVWAMLRAAPHRGPDGMAVAGYGQVALGCAAFVVTPEEADEHQPIQSARTGCAIVADARLDNRADLLDSLGNVPATISDAELLLRLYEAQSVTMLPALLGDFAFILWDPRSRQLVCARDTSGQRDLFYHCDGRALTVATELQQLFADPSMPIVVNERRLEHYLTPISMQHNATQIADTFLQDVKLLEAGHVLIYDECGLRTRRYWQLQPSKPIVYRRDEEYADHFRALLFDAVRVRLRTRAPVGAMLSGGLDSASVVCSAMQLVQSGAFATTQPIRGYTAAFEHDAQNERGFVSEIAAQYDLSVSYTTPHDYAGRLRVENTAWLDAPDDAVPEFYETLFDHAERDGARVLLTGEIADAYIGGSPFVLDRLLRRLRFREFVHTYRTVRAISPLPRRDAVLRGCVIPLLPDRLQTWARHVNTTRFRRSAQGRILPAWIPERRRRAIEQCHWELSTELDLKPKHQFVHTVHHQAYDALYPPEVGFRAYGRALQIARPYADRRLHQFVLAIPPEILFETSKTVASLYEGQKQLVRQAMTGILPETLRTRKTKTFFTNVWQREVDAQWESCQRLFGPGGKSEAVERGFIDRERFWQRLCAARTGEVGSDHRYLMAMLGVETWLASVRFAAAGRQSTPPVRSEGAAMAI